jgi:ElaB/YqjD/DUF883 family membrane-anchored ribosome-binding protein
MAEEFSNEAEASGTEQPKAETRQAWVEVGHHFEQLGQSLATAFRTLWESEETQQNVESLRDGLQSMAADVSAAVNKSVTSEDTEKIKAEAQKAAKSAQAATEKTAEEIRPQVTKALKQVNAELQKLIERLETEKDAD